MPPGWGRVWLWMWEWDRRGGVGILVWSQVERMGQPQRVLVLMTPREGLEVLVWGQQTTRRVVVIKPSPIIITTITTTTVSMGTMAQLGVWADIIIK